MTEAQTPRWSVAPYFIVDDVVATANFCRDKLGFHYDRFWGEPSCFAMVRRFGITITRKQPEARGACIPTVSFDPEDSSWDAYIWVDDANVLYEEFQRKTVATARPMCDQPYAAAISISRLQRLHPLLRPQHLNDPEPDLEPAGNSALKAARMSASSRSKLVQRKSSTLIKCAWSVRAAKTR